MSISLPLVAASFRPPAPGLMLVAGGHFFLFILQLAHAPAFATLGLQQSLTHC
jgi:hypothetical protein